MSFRRRETIAKQNIRLFKLSDPLLTVLSYVEFYSPKVCLLGACTSGTYSPIESRFCEKQAH